MAFLRTGRVINTAPKSLSALFHPWKPSPAPLSGKQEHHRWALHRAHHLFDPLPSGLWVWRSHTSKLTNSLLTGLSLISAWICLVLHLSPLTVYITPVCYLFQLFISTIYILFWHSWYEAPTIISLFMYYDNNGLLYFVCVCIHLVFSILYYFPGWSDCTACIQSNVIHSITVCFPCQIYK